MTIVKMLDGNTMTLVLEGRLDTSTAPQLDEVLKQDLDSVRNLTLDFEKLEYISSAGLRVLIWAYQTLDARGGTLKMEHVSDMIRETFDLTGLSELLNG